MNKKVLGIAAAAAAAGGAVYAASKVKPQQQHQYHRQLHKLSQLKPNSKRLEKKPALQIKQYRNKSQLLLIMKQLQTRLKQT